MNPAHSNNSEEDSNQSESPMDDVNHFHAANRYFEKWIDGKCWGFLLFVRDAVSVWGDLRRSEKRKNENAAVKSEEDRAALMKKYPVEMVKIARQNRILQIKKMGIAALFVLFALAFKMPELAPNIASSLLRLIAASSHSSGSVQNSRIEH